MPMRWTISRMKTKLLSVIMTVFVGVALTVHADDRKDLDKEVKEAIELFKKTDPEMNKIFESSVGYAIYPRVAKGGFGIGAARGTGQLIEKGKTTGEAKLTQVSIGLQLGGQVYAEVIFFENDTTLTNFKESKLEFSAQVSAVAAAEGASKNAKFEHGVAVFTLAKGGLMYEASVGGQKFKFEKYD